MKDWDWVKMLPGSSDGFENFVMLEIVHRAGHSSRWMAIHWDDETEFDGHFQYRDWTSSGMPWLKDDKKYWSGFWFEKLEDAKEFQKRYGGSGNWQADHQEFVDGCNQERNS